MRRDARSTARLAPSSADVRVGPVRPRGSVRSGPVRSVRRVLKTNKQTVLKMLQYTRYPVSTSPEVNIVTLNGQSLSLYTYSSDT